MTPREGPPAISPRARRAARELLVPFQALPVPAPGRRITERDVKTAAAAFDAVKMTAKARRLAWQKGLDAGTLARIANGRALDVADVEKLPAVPLRLPAERVKMSADERTRIDRLSAAIRDVPVTTVGVFVLASEIRRASKDGDAVPYLVRAVGSLLAEEEFKNFRAVVDGSDWIFRGQINVAVGTPDGFVVIHNADRRSVSEIHSTLTPALAFQGGDGECTGAMVAVYSLAGSGVDYETVRPLFDEAAALSLSPPKLKPQLRDRKATGLALPNGWDLGLTVDERRVSKKLARIFLLRLKSLLENASYLLGC